MIKIPKTSEDRLRLLIAYSRFEFALKECGYVIPQPGIAYADWQRFAKEKCFRDVMMTAADDADVEEMIAEPPQMQVTDGDRFWRWEEQMAKPITSLFVFFQAVKQVRDNLFHGGKQGEDPRDDVLCRAAWVVLALCLEHHHEVRNAFEGKY